MLQPLQIKSVIVKEHMKGNIYIEAYKKSHVEQAIDGVTALNANKIQVCLRRVDRFIIDTILRWCPSKKWSTHFASSRTCRR
jgi:hypothetical protein